MKRKYTKKVKPETATVLEVMPVDEQPLEQPIITESFEMEISAFITAVVALVKPKRVLEIGCYSPETTENIVKLGGESGTYKTLDSSGLKEYRSINEGKFDLVLVTNESPFIVAINDFKIIERILARNGTVIYTNTKSNKASGKVVELASRMGYKTNTLDSTAGNGISVISK